MFSRHLFGLFLTQRIGEDNASTFSTVGIQASQLSSMQSPMQLVVNFM